MEDLNQFRQQTRAWLLDNCPAEMREPMRSDEDLCWGGSKFQYRSEAQRQWLLRMADRGWTAPEWPTEYGGGGLSREQAQVLREEMTALHCRAPLKSFGISMLGPALLKHGTEAQKREHLPPIVRGQVRWCQGYSEPNAGSDLAALQTRAEDKGDHFLVNGQKIWTSYADKADWIFCLVRTDFAARKQSGISFVLFDMATPGVQVRPITLISGKSPFCETFFDNVRVDKSNLVGEINGGWDIAKYLLTHEREMVSGNAAGAVGSADKPLGATAAAAIGMNAQGELDDAMLRVQIANFEIDDVAFACLRRRAADLARQGEGQGAFSSVLKYYGSELNKRRYELLMSAGGSDALEWQGERSAEGKLARGWLRTKGNSIEGGTSEVQLNIIAKRLLGLPGA